tara:strand:- start:5847 stop:6098 length:252 start_codon:yes stop_codon:yes gene_type:complete
MDNLLKNKIKIIQAIFIICSFAIFIGKNWNNASESLNKGPVNDFYIDNSDPYSGSECIDDSILLRRAKESVTSPILEYKVSIN